MTDIHTFNDFWESEDQADVVFLVGEQPGAVWRIATHKLILSNRNSVFYDMFYGKAIDSIANEVDKEDDETQTKENGSPSSERQRNDSEIRIKDIQPEIFDQLLRFIYCGELNIDTVDSAILFHQAAHKYKIKEIVNKSINYLVENLSATNVFDVYHCLEDYLDEKESLPLLSKCAVIIDKAADKVFSTNAFLRLSSETVEDITSRDSLQLSSELVLFKALLRWSASECKRRGLPITNENKRLVLDRIFHNVRFGLLTEQELSVLDPFKEEGLFKKSDGKLLNSKSCPRHYVCRYTENKHLGLKEKSNEKIISFASNKEILLTSLTFSNVYFKKCIYEHTTKEVETPVPLPRETYGYSCESMQKTVRKAPIRTLKEVSISGIKEFKLFKKDTVVFEINNAADLFYYLTTDKDKTVVSFPDPVYVEPETVYSIDFVLNDERDYYNCSYVSVWDGGAEYSTIQWKRCGNMFYNDNDRPFELGFSPPLRSSQPPAYNFWTMGGTVVKSLKSKLKTKENLAKVKQKWKQLFPS